MIVRDTTPADNSAVRKVLIDAFGQPDEAALVKNLRASGDAVVDLVAEIDGDIVGHILMSALPTPDKCLALAPVCVAPRHQGQGIGSALICAGLERAKAEGWGAVFLLGEPEFYARFGFSVSDAADFETPYPRPYFMALELVRGTLADKRGDVIYPAPFLDLG